MKAQGLMQGTAILAAAVLAASLGGGCGLFEARDPISPPPGGAACRSLTDVDAALANIQDFYGRIDGLTCYAGLLDTSFVFHADPLDVVEAPPGTFDNWDEVVEAGATSNLSVGADSVAARFVSEYQGRDFPDIRTEIRYYDYRVNVRNLPADPILLYTGQAALTFRRGNDSQWRLADWVDRRGAVNDSTWGRLRRDHR